MSGQAEGWQHQNTAGYSPSEVGEAIALPSKEREVSKTTSAQNRTGLTQILRVVVHIHSIIKCF